MVAILVSLQDFLRLQNEAGIKQLKDECEKEIINYKSELERSNHLRQKEVFVIKCFIAITC